MLKLATVFFAGLALWGGAVVLAGDEPPIQGEGPEATYLAALHEKVHRLWTDTFLVLASGQLPKEHPINVQTRAVLLEIVLTPEGKVADIKVAKPSGSDDFDASAVDVIKSSGPFVEPPEDVLSDDDKVHILWTLARDDRRCSSTTVDKQQRPLEQAMPMLVAQGREKIALERLASSDDKARQAGFTAFARAWLDRSERDDAMALRVSLANAVAGDGRGAEKLCKAIAVGEQGECLTAALSVAKNRQAAAATRIAAIEVLGTRDEPEARAALRELFKDSTPAIRAAAILAEVRAGAGRGALFRLTALLHDPSVEVRAAAAAGVVRVGGEPALTQLFLLFREKDVRPYQAVARELGGLSGEESAEMLTRFLGRDDRRIQLAGARAVARRHDPAVAKAQGILAGSTDPELRFLGAATLTDAEQRSSIVAAPDGYAWKDSFAALAEGPGKLVAVDWILAQFPRLDPETRIDLMGAWLAAVKN